MTPRTPARAEVVGSLLRPPALKAAVEAFYEPGHSAALAEERIVTDGEFRRWMFMNSFYDAVSGVRTGKAVRFRNERGEDVELNVHEIVNRLRVVGSPAAREAAFTALAAGGYPFKVTFPAASIFTHPLTTVAGPDGGGYGSLEEFVRHAIEIERQLVADAVAAGARYVQFDFPLYPYLVDPMWIDRFRAAGHDIGTLVERAIVSDAAVLEGTPPDVTVGLHICRGNYRSSWMCEGFLEPVAERVFAELPYDRFLVEWDDLGRDGGFEPIRFLRPGSEMVMGLVSTKTPRLEDQEDLLRRMEEAAGYLDGMDRLAISPQCGFASVMVGNDIDEEMQWRKLDLVAGVADRLWGSG